MFLFLTFYFQTVLGYSALRAAFAFLPFSAGIIVGAGVISQLLPRVGPKPLMISGLVSAILGMLWLTQIDLGTSYASHVLPSQLLISLGMAGVFVPASSTALVGIDPHDAGAGSALLNTTQQIGGSLGTALLNTLYASAVTGYVAAASLDRANAQDPVVQLEALLHGYRVSYFWGAVLMAGALIAAIVLIDAKKDDIPTGDAGTAAVHAG
jgi:MFS family permease